MASPAQVSANRRNAARSTGPRTSIGKAIVAQNAIKHGLLARQHVVMGEDSQQFELCRRQWLEEIQPVTNAETTLAERIAGLTWRLKRAERLQNELFDCLLIQELDDSMEEFDDELSPEDQEELASDPRTDPALAVGRMLKRDYAHERALERLMAYERWIENSLYKSMKELRQVQQERKAQGGDGPGVSCAPHPQFHGETPSTGATPCGVTTNEAESMKQSQSAAEEDGYTPPCEIAKQSQLMAAEGGQRPPCETGTDHPMPMPPSHEDGTTDSAKQSQSADEPPCGTKPIDPAELVCRP